MRDAQCFPPGSEPLEKQRTCNPTCPSSLPLDPRGNKHRKERMNMLFAEGKPPYLLNKYLPSSLAAL